MLHTGHIDELLRREISAVTLLEKRMITPIGLVLRIVILGAIYGVCMGLYGLKWGSGDAMHVASVALKVPALFLLTLLVTCPSLYVCSALSRSPLSPRATVGLLLAATLVSMVVLASLGPVTAFFTFSTESYAFMQVLNVIVFCVASVIGLRFLLTTMKAELPNKSISGAFMTWLLIYGAVGLQMVWILRPFVATVAMEPDLGDDTQLNVFEGLIDALSAPSDSQD